MRKQDSFQRANYCSENRSNSREKQTTEMVSESGHTIWPQTFDDFKIQSMFQHKWRSNRRERKKQVQRSCKSQRNIKLIKISTHIPDLDSSVGI